MNTVKAEGRHKGVSVLFMLASVAQGQQLLEDDKLRGKITTEGLNAVISTGEHWGKSAIFCLAVAPIGQQLLIDDEINLPIQVKGKLVTTINTKKGYDEDKILIPLESMVVLPD